MNEQRFHTDALYRYQVELVARSLWSAVAVYTLGMERPIPMDRLMDETRRDLYEYAAAVVEDLEAEGMLKEPAPGPTLSATVWTESTHPLG